MSEAEYSNKSSNIVLFVLFEVVMVPLLSFYYLWLKVWFDILGNVLISWSIT